MRTDHSVGLICRFRGQNGKAAPIITVITAYCLFLNSMTYAQQVRDQTVFPTSTQITPVNDTVTRITTGTQIGINAYNSFSIFNVDAGKTVNLIVPDSASNLINLVHDQRSDINGVLNSIKDNKVGGNVFFANPHGFVVGSEGVVNVGALTVATPTPDFMNHSFLVPERGAQMLIDGSVPIDPEGLISIQGKINAINGLNLNGGNINIAGSGLINTRSVFDWNDSVNFSDVVNIGALQSGSSISIEGGDVFIRAESTLESNGKINTDGADVDLGSAGTLTLDSGTISTRDLANPLFDDHLVGNSAGDSGNITLASPKITLDPGTALLSHVVQDNSTAYQGGNINLKAEDLYGVYVPLIDLKRASAGITLNSATLKGKDVTLEATARASTEFDDDGTPSNAAVNFLDGLSVLAGVAKSDAGAEVLINGTTSIEASTLTLNATAQTNATVSTISRALGAAYAESNPTAKVIVGDGTHTTVIKTTGDVTLNSKAESYLDSNAYTVYLGNSRGSTTDVTFAYGSSDITSTAQIAKGVDAGMDGGSGAIGGNLEVNATVLKNQNLSALSGAYEDGSVGAAAVISLSDSKAEAFVDGQVTAQSISVVADSQTPKNDAVASTEAGSGLISGAIVRGANYVLDRLSSKTKSTDPRSGSSAKVKLSGAVAYADHDNAATARIGDSAQVASLLATASSPVPDGILIKSNIVDVPEIAAVSMVDSDAIDKKGGNTSENSVSAAVVIGDYTNNATSYIGKNATADANNPITVTSRTSLPWEIQWENIDTENLGGSIFSNIKDKLNPNLGIQNGFFTSWAQSMAQGTKTALAGSVNILDINNTSKAYIGEGAKVNQNAGFSPDDIKVLATNDVETMNLSGILSAGSIMGDLKDLFSNITSGKIQPNTNKPGTAGVGGSYLQVNYDNIVEAVIKNGAQVTADTLQVEAQSTTRNISIAESGGKAGTYAIDGAFALNFSNDRTIAKIDDGAIIATGQKSIPGDAESNNVLVRAADTAEIYNVNGGIARGENVGVGLSVSVNEITRDTKSLIGNLQGEENETDGSLESGGKVKVAASNEGTVVAASLAAAVATSELGATEPPADGFNTQSAAGREKFAQFLDSTMKNQKPRFGLGISGDVSVNLIKDTAEAYIKEARVSEAAQLDLNARNGSDIFSLAGSAAYSKANNTSVGLAGSVTWNELDNTTKSYIEDSIISDVGQLKLNADSTESITTIAASGSGAVSRVSDSGIGIAGSVAYNYIGNETAAFINNSDLSDLSDTSLTAADDSTIVSIAGSANYGGKAGFGASIAINTVGNTTKAYVAGSDLVSDGNLVISAEERSEVTTVSAAIGAAKDGMAVEASATGTDVSNTTTAYISGRKEDGITVDGNVSLAASDDVDTLSVAGNIAIAKGGRDGVSGSGFGVSAAVTVTDNTVESYIGSESVVTAKGTKPAIEVYTGQKDDAGNRLTESMKGISVTATSYEDILGIAAGGAGAEKIAVEGSAAVHVLDETTKAHIDSGAIVTAGDPVNGNLQGTEQRVNVLASDNTDILGIAGAAMGSLRGGVGAGADVGIITKETSAYVGNNASVAATEDIRIQSLSREDINSVAGTVALGRDWAFGGAASVYSVTNKTRSYIDGGDVSTTNVHADGNILVSSSNETETDSIAGSGVFGRSAGIGASAATVVTDKTTESYIGKNAKVTAEGKRAGVDVATGRFVLGTVDNTGDDYSVDSSDTANLNLNTAVDTTQAASAETKTITGIGVTAISKDDVSGIAASGGGSGTAAINIAGSVTVIGNNTSAYIAEGAKINEDQTASADGQSVLVAAGTDLRHLGISAAVSLGGQVGLGPAAEVIVVDNNTKAYIEKSAQVDAREDIEIAAEASEDVLSIAGAGALGIGAVGLAGSVPVISIDNETMAYIDSSADHDSAATITAGGNIAISAKDRTETDIIAGSLAGGAVGIGGAVGVTLIEKDTRAFAGNNAVVNAEGNSDSFVSVHSGLNDDGTFARKNIKGLSIQAESKEDFSTITGAFAGGYAGVAGAVIVNDISSTTLAYVGEAALVNQDTTGANSEQNVNLSAVNTVNDFAVAGSAAAGAGALAGGLGFHTIRNDTSAYVGDKSRIQAANDLELKSFSNAATDTYAASAAGGAVGIAGGITVLSFGKPPDDATAAEMAEKGGNTGYQNPSNYANEQANYDYMNAAVSDSYGMDQIKADARAQTSAINATPAATEVPAGVAAFIGKGAAVQTGGNIDIEAREVVDVKMKSGAAAAGVASVGGSVGIASVQNQVKAYIDDGDETDEDRSINAAGNISVSSVLNEKTDNKAYAGSLSGFVSISGAVTYLNNDYLVDAHLGKNLKIDSADQVSVSALTTTNNSSHSLEGGIAGLGAAAGLSYAEVDSDGTTISHVDDSARIGLESGGSATVNGLKVSANSSNSGDTSSKHLSGGLLLAGGYNEADSSINPTVTATIGSDVNLNLENDLTVGARADVNSTAYTWGGAFSAVTIGPGKAESSVKPVVSASIAGGDQSDINAKGDVNVVALGNHDWDNQKQTRSVSAENDAIGGSLLVSYVEPSSTATSDWTVDAHLGADADIEAAGDMKVLAKGYSGEVTSDVDGHAYSLLGAIGNKVATSNVFNRVSAYIGQDASVSADMVDVDAQGTSAAVATTTGGAGGLATGASASSNTNVTNTVSAYLTGNEDDDDAKVAAARDLTVSSLSRVDFNAKGSSTGIGVIFGANGAHINNTVSSTSNAYIGEDGAAEAGNDILVDALSNIQKPDIGVNLSSGGGGIIDAPAVNSTTTITNTAAAYVAGNSSSGRIETVNAGRDITVAAATDVLAHDKATLTSGGLIAVADVHSTINNVNTSASSVGDHARVVAGNDVNLQSRTNASVTAITYTEGYGLGASADGTAIVNVTADNDTRIADGATVEAGNDVNIHAGKGRDDLQNNLRAHAEAQSFSAGGIPMSSVTAKAHLYDYNDISIGNAGVKAGGDINLGAYSGLSSVRGYAKAKMRSYLLFGIPITWFDSGTRESTPAYSNTVTVNGVLESGLNHNKVFHIDAAGRVADGSNIGFAFTPDIDGAEELRRRIEALDEQIANAKDISIKTILGQERDGYEARLNTILEKRNNPDAPDPTFGNFDRFTLGDITVGSGNIDITGDLRGNGTLRVPGNDFKIEIFNDSLAHLELNRLEIPSDLRGDVLLNGRVINSHGTVTIDPGKNLGKRIIVENRYDPDFPGNDENASSDMVLKGDITNAAGTIDIVNQSGSIESLGDIDGDEVTIFANREFSQGYTAGVWNSPNVQVSGGNINISGQILNIRGTIQSGTPFRTVTIPEFDPELLVADANGRKLIPTTGDSNIQAFWDDENQCIQLYNAKVTGGNITLAGEIVSTGGGKLKVIDGYGEIHVTNNSSRDLVINRLDAGNRIKGMVKITDTGRPDSQGNPLVTQISGEGDGLNVLQYRVRWDETSNSVRIVDGSERSNPVVGRTTQYRPRAGARYIGDSSWAISNRNPGLDPIFDLLDFLSPNLVVEADRAIDVEFGGSSAPKIDVAGTGPGNILINNNITSKNGSVSIRNDKGSIYSLNEVAQVRGNSISLSAPEGEVGDTVHAIAIDTQGGTVEAHARGDVNIREVEGDLTVKSIRTSGNATVTSDGSIFGSGTADPAITARDITLLSENGSIGQMGSALTIDSQDGILKAEAAGDIYLSETSGALRVNRVVSAEGDVVLSADGPIEDHNVSASSDDDTLEKIAAARRDLGLGDPAKIQEAIAAHKEQKRKEYQALHRISDNGTPFEPNDDTYDDTYDPLWEYVLTAEEETAFAQSVWKDEELINSKNRLTDPESGAIVPEQANVVGNNITLISNANIGTYGGKVVISGADVEAGNITSDQRALLVNAEAGDVSFDGATGDVTISLDKDFDIEARGNVSIQAKDYVYLNSDSDISVDRIVSQTGDIELTAGGSILNGASAEGVNLNARNITLSSNGSIGGPGNRRVLADSSGILNAFAAGDIYLGESSGSLVSEITESRTGSVDIVASDGGLDIASLTAAQNVVIRGEGDVLIDRLHSSSLDARVAQPGGNLTVRDASIADIITLNADNIFLAGVEQAASEKPIRFDVSGRDGNMAETVEIRVNPRSFTEFGTLAADKANIFSSGRLMLDNVLIGNSAWFSDGTYRVVVENLDRKLRDAELQLYSGSQSFYLYFPVADRNFLTNALVINYKDNFSVNGFGTENSVTRLIPKMLHTTASSEEKEDGSDPFSFRMEPVAHTPGPVTVVSPDWKSISIVDENDAAVIKE